MAEMIQCHVTNRDLAELLFKKAKEIGIYSSVGMDNVSRYPWIVFRSTGTMAGNDVPFHDASKVDFHALYDSVATFVKPPPPITITSRDMQYTVEFRPNDYDGIKVGCTSIPTATVDEIYKRLHEAK